MTPLILCLHPSSADALALALLGVALGLGVLLIGDSRRGERCEEQPPAPRPRWLPHLHGRVGEVTRVAADGYPWLEPGTCAPANRCPGRPDVPAHRERLFSSVSGEAQQAPPGRPPLSKLLESGDTISLSLDDVDCSPALPTTLPGTRRARLAHVEEDRWRQAPPTAELRQLALRLHGSPALDFLLYGDVRGR